MDDYRNRPNYCQCSMCFQFYTFNEYLNLESEWIDPKNKKRFGKQAICKCGARFHRDLWHIETLKEEYLISTVHLVIGHSSVIDWSDLNDNYFYETMIFKLKNKKNNSDRKALDFQMRYKTKEEAITGHQDTVNKLEKILLDPTKYPMGIIPMVCNALEAANDQKKTIQQDVKERLK